MRELTVRIRFTKHCLGNVHAKDGSGRLLLPRTPGGSVAFMASWHLANMRFSAQVLSRHQDEVGKIYWDISVDGVVRSDPWFRRYYRTAAGKKTRFVLHEAFLPDQVVGLNCIVPATITDDDLWQLMRVAGQYKGISPARPGEFGLFEVESIRPRRAAQEVERVTEPAKAP